MGRIDEQHSDEFLGICFEGKAVRRRIALEALKYVCLYKGKIDEFVSKTCEENCSE